MRSRRLHFMVTKSSTISGANLFLSGVTILPATENTRSDLEEAAGMGKTTLTRSANLGRAFEEKNKKRRNENKKQIS